MKILLKIFKFYFEFWKGSNKSQWIIFPVLNSTSKMLSEFTCQNSGPGGALSISEENYISTFFNLLMSVLDWFETWWYQWKACFVNFQMYVSFFVFQAFEVLKLLSENSKNFPFSWRGPKVVLLKLILRLIKRLIALSIVFFECVFDVLYNHAKK